MKFDITNYLDEHNLSYRVDGNNLQLKECVSCGNSKYKFGIALHKNLISNCFVCEEKFNLYQFIMVVEQISYKEAYQRVNNPYPKTKPVNIRKKLEQINFSMTKKENGNLNYSELLPVQIPKEFMKLESHDKFGYTKKRGLSLDIIKIYNLHVCYEGIWENRLIIPIYHNGVLVGWQGRDMTNKKPIKIKSMKGFQKSKFILNGDAIRNSEIGIICEGPFDCMSASRLDKRVTPVALFGKQLSDAQLNILLKSKLRYIYVGLDPDFPESILKVARQIAPYFKVKIMVIPRDKDLGDLNYHELKRAFVKAISMPSKFSSL